MATNLLPILFRLPFVVLFVVTTVTEAVYDLEINFTFSPSVLVEDDDLLSQLASQVNANPNPCSPKKLAFMFLTTSPLPLAPLWELYFSHSPKNLYNIYIHADPSFEYVASFEGVFRNRTIPSKPTSRHTPTLIEAHRRLLSYALLDDQSNYMFVLVSSSCIPLHSFNFTYETLIQSRKSFIEILKNEPRSSDRWAARGSEAMLPEVTLEDFRIGSQFSALTRRHARIAVSDTQVWNKFKIPCEYESLNDCYPEESYLPTFFSMVDPCGCIPATLTHVDWKGTKDGHPRTYHMSDMGPDLIMALQTDRPRYGNNGICSSDSSVIKRHDPFLFARKFAADTIQPLLRIANDSILKH